MNNRIFLLHADGRLDPLRERACESEDLLQALLARHPELLTGDQADDEPRQWLLVAREMGVPGETDGGNRWAVDHLFLDRDGVPTLVEVKRATDTRIRREVVGQLLDYAANAVVYWPADGVRAGFEAGCAARGDDPEAVLAEFLGDIDPEKFWQDVKTNLQAGRVRLVFVADEIPPELARVVEFLNAQMDPAEVLAVEVRQYAGAGGVSTVVPRLIGQTATAGRRKGGPSADRVAITEVEFLDAARAALSADELPVAVAVVEWARRAGFGMNFKRGARDTSFLPAVQVGRRTVYPISLEVRSGLWVQLRYLRKDPVVADPALRAELRRRLEVTGVTVPNERMTGYPQIPYPALVRPAALDAALDALGWLVARLAAPNPDPAGAPKPSTEA